jgi:hypothetical protein
LWSVKSGNRSASICLVDVEQLVEGLVDVEQLVGSGPCYRPPAPSTSVELVDVEQLVEGQSVTWAVAPTRRASQPGRAVPA